jgi:hypothetical protein
MTKKAFKNIRKCILLSLAFFCLLLLGSTMQVKAASNVVSLTVGKTYKTTLTGTKKHTVRFTYSRDSYGNVKSTNLYIDGKKLRTLRDMDRTTVYLCKVASGRNLLYVHGEGPSDDTVFIKVYEYKTSLKEIGDLTTLTRTGFANRVEYGMLQSAGSNKLTVRWVVQPFTVGYNYIDVSYKIGTSQISRIGTQYRLMKYQQSGSTHKYVPVTSKWTATRALTTYTEMGGKKVSFKIAKGEKVTINYISGKKGQTYLLVKNAKGKTGWLKDPSTFSIKKYFKEAVFAG